MKIALRIDGRIELDGSTLPVAETLAILDGIADDSALRGAAKRAGRPEPARAAMAFSPDEQARWMVAPAVVSTVIVPERLKLPRSMM